MRGNATRTLDPQLLSDAHPHSGHPIRHPLGELSTNDDNSPVPRDLSRDGIQNRPTQLEPQLQEVGFFLHPPSASNAAHGPCVCVRLLKLFSQFCLFYILSCSCLGNGTCVWTLGVCVPVSHTRLLGRGCGFMHPGPGTGLARLRNC